MCFGLKKHVQMQEDFKNYNPNRDSEFSELYAHIEQLFEVFGREYYWYIGTEVFIGKFRLDLIIYVPDKLCIVVELKTHFNFDIRNKLYYSYESKLKKITDFIKESAYEFGKPQIPLYTLLYNKFYYKDETPSHYTIVPYVTACCTFELRDIFPTSGKFTTASPIPDLDDILHDHNYCVVAK